MTDDWSSKIGIPDASEPLVEARYNAEFEAMVARILGPKELPDSLTRLAGRQWVAAAMLPFFMRHDTVHVEPDLALLALFLSSAVNDCRYSYGFFRSRLILVGHRREKLSRLTEAVLSDRPAQQPGDELDALVGLIRLAASLNHTSSQGNRTEASPGGAPGDGAPARQELFERFETLGVPRSASRELAATVAQASFFNRVCTLLAMPPYERAEAMVYHPMIRVVRPIIGRSIRGRRIKPTEPPPDDGEFYDIINDLSGTWYAPWIATTIDRCLDKQTEIDGFGIPERLAAIEIVAGALGAAGLRKEAHRRLSRTRGASLSEELSAWFKMTVHYRARSANAQTARLGRSVDSDLLIDAVGTAALANMLARVELLLGPG